MKRLYLCNHFTFIKYFNELVATEVYNDVLS